MAGRRTAAHAVILAGGAGTRLWPLSRRQRPKQFVRLFGGQSLLRRAFERAAPLFPLRSIWVIGAAEHADLVAAELPELPADRFIGEPCGRNTAHAIGLAAHLIRAADADATMCVFTADHLITPADRFGASVERGFGAVAHEPQALVTFGVRPRLAHTGYGYIRRGEEVQPGVFAVAAFHEKPDLATASRYVEAGDCDWNSGIFCWRVSAILEQLRARLPESDAVLARLAAAGGVFDAAGRAAWAALPSISIDHAVLEQAPCVRVVPLDCDWLDVGSWDALAQTATPDADGNVQIGGDAARLDAAGNLVLADEGRLVALIGVRDLVVIQSQDVTLVCRRSDAQRVRELVARVWDEHGARYL